MRKEEGGTEGIEGERRKGGRESGKVREGERERSSVVPCQHFKLCVSHVTNTPYVRLTKKK